MSGRILHVQLSSEAKASLEARAFRRNRAGRTLRDWLVRSFQVSRGTRSSQTSIFGTTIEVDEDVPLLLEALGRVTKQSPDNLVEGWALETPGDADIKDATPTAVVHLSDDVRGKLAELLDLGETLFEETVSDARRKLGPYPEVDKAGHAGADIFKGLRTILGISGPESDVQDDKKGAGSRS